MASLSPTQTDFLTRLSQQGVRANRAVSIGLLKRRTTGGIATTSYLVSSEPYQNSIADADFKDYLGMLQTSGPAEQDVSDVLRGESVIGGPSTGTLTVENHNQELDSVFGPGEYSTNGQTIEEYLVSDSLPYADRIPIKTVIGGTATLTDTRLTVAIQGGTGFLKNLIPHGTLEESEFPNLPEENRGVTKPRAWGRVRQVEPIMVRYDDLYYIAEEVSAVTDVQVGGVAWTEGTQWTWDSSDSSVVQLLNAPPQGAKVTVSFRGAPLRTGVYSADVGEIIEDLIIQYGDSNATIDVDCFTSFTTNRPYNVGIYERNSRSVGEVATGLLRGLFAWIITDGSGTIRIDALHAPATTAKASFAEADLRDLTTFSRRAVDPLYGMEIRHSYNEVTFSESELSALFTEDGTTYGSLLEYYKRGYATTAPADDPGLLTTYPTRSLGPFATRIANRADALAHRDAMLALFASTKDLIVFTVDALGHNIDIGDTINLSRDRMNLESGQNYLVIGKQDNGDDGNTVTLTVWGP